MIVPPRPGGAAAAAEPLEHLDTPKAGGEGVKPAMTYEECYSEYLKRVARWRKMKSAARRAICWAEEAALLAACEAEATLENVGQVLEKAVVGVVDWIESFTAGTWIAITVFSAILVCGVVLCIVFPPAAAAVIAVITIVAA